MRPALLFALAVSTAPAFAQESEPALEPDFHCDQRNLSAELAALCAGLAEGFHDVMSRPVESHGGGRPKLAPRPAAVRREVVARGLDGKKIDRARNPFDVPDERGVGLRLKTEAAPVEFFTEMVQPGAEADTILNWQLKTEKSSGPSGLFYGAATSGTYNDGATESLSGFAGLRGVARPDEALQLGAEIAPRAALNDLSSPDASLWLEPKLTAKSDLGRLGDSNFTGTFDANAGYNLPLEGDPSAYGGFRFTVRPQVRP